MQEEVGSIQTAVSEKFDTIDYDTSVYRGEDEHEVEHGDEEESCNLRVCPRNVFKGLRAHSQAVKVLKQPSMDPHAT